MKKILHTYEEKNKIIEEIQRNLRLPDRRNLKITRKITIHNPQIALPIISSRGQKNKNNLFNHPIEKKYPSMRKQTSFELQHRSFEEENRPNNFNEQKSLEKQSKLLVLSPTSRNKTFLLTPDITKKSGSFDNFLEDEEFFTPRKVILGNRSKSMNRKKKSLHTIKAQSKAKIEETEHKQRKQRKSYPINSVQIERTETKSQSPQKTPLIKKLQLKKNKEVKKNEELRKIEKARKNEKVLKRSYSPWNSDLDEGINNIWQLNRK